MEEGKDESQCMEEDKDKSESSNLKECFHSEGVQCCRLLVGNCARIGSSVCIRQAAHAFLRRPLICVDTNAPNFVPRLSMLHLLLLALPTFVSAWVWSTASVEESATPLQ